MPFRRPTFDPGQAHVRAATPEDLTAISRMLSTARHFLAHFAGEYLPELLGNSPASVLATLDGTLWGAIVAGTSQGNTTWLRTIVLADGLPVDLGLTVLIPHFHDQARHAGITHIYYAGDSSTEHWLSPRLRTYQYVHDTYVITYAKSLMDAPTTGNPNATIRFAEPDDLATLLEIDSVCFEPQWVKRRPVFEPSLQEADYVIVAQIEQQVVGYALVVSSFGGKQLHLVRIAVLPGFQRQAIGVRLLSEVIRYAQTRHTTQLTLNTQEYNVQARGVYEWFGFQLTGERQLILRYDLEKEY
jgi:[ribosomal protein S18]-alanine N-acetyltransferase